MVLPGVAGEHEEEMTSSVLQLPNYHPDLVLNAQETSLDEVDKLHTLEITKVCIRPLRRPLRYSAQRDHVSREPDGHEKDQT